MDEETYEYTSSYVYDREGNLVYETDASVTYYNGIVAVVDTYESFEIEGEEFGYYIMNLIDLATGDIIVDAENIYCEGGYIFAESTLKRPFGTSLYTTDGEYIGGKDGWIVCIDEGNYTIILEDADAEKLRAKEWKRQGLLLEDQEILNAMDPADVGRLCYSTKKDGTLTGDLASREQLKMLETYIFRTLGRLVEQIASGDVSPNPYTRGNYGACTYCPYGSICHKEEVENRRNYKTMQPDRFWTEVEKELKENGG